MKIIEYQIQRFDIRMGDYHDKDRQSKHNKRDI